MSQRVPYPFDPDDPRAPSVDDWARMTEAEHAQVVANLPAEVPFDLAPPDGDAHRKAKESVLDALGAFFRRTGRRVYLSSELAVYYPNEPRFAPDILAVVDAPTHERDRWVVSAEGKGLDLVIEILVHGDSNKDLERNVVRFARLGIREYFVFDRGRSRLRGYALSDANARAYRPILPQDGRLASQVLGLDLVLEGQKIRFYLGTAPLQESEELIGKLGVMVNDLIAKKDDESRRIEEAEHRADAEAQRADEAERRVRELLAEIERTQ